MCGHAGAVAAISICTMASGEEIPVSTVGWRRRRVALCTVG
jgi:hypothetical protein